MSHSIENDPVVELPPLDRHGNEEIKTFSESWENPDDLLQEFIKLTNGCEGIVFGVMDTGIYTRNPYVRNANYGRIGDQTNSRSGTNDFNGHGTFVLHQILRRCPKATFHVQKVLGDSGGGTSSGIVRGLREFIRGGVMFGNASLGAGSRYNPMGDALREMQEAGMILAAASGNSGGQMGWPALWGVGFNVIPLGAFNNQFRRSSFSSFGSPLLGLGAGESIIAARAQSDGLTRMSGTSMGCPNACALIGGYHAARMQAGWPKSSTSESLTALVASIAEDMERDGRDTTTGFGLLTLRRTVDAIKKIEPKDPSNLKAAA